MQPKTVTLRYLINQPTNQPRKGEKFQLISNFRNHMSVATLVNKNNGFRLHDKNVAKISLIVLKSKFLTFSNYLERGFSNAYQTLGPISQNHEIMNLRTSTIFLLEKLSESLK